MLSGALAASLVFLHPEGGTGTDLVILCHRFLNYA